MLGVSRYLWLFIVEHSLLAEISLGKGPTGVGYKQCDHCGVTERRKRWARRAVESRRPDPRLPVVIAQGVLTVMQCSPTLLDSDLIVWDGAQAIIVLKAPQLILMCAGVENHWVWQKEYIVVGGKVFSRANLGSNPLINFWNLKNVWIHCKTGHKQC